MTIRIELARAHRKRYEQSPWWVDSEQIRRVLGPPDPTQLALLVDDRGDALAWGLYSPDSPRPFRALCVNPGQAMAPMPESWLQDRLARACAARLELLRSGQTTAVRLVNSEGDGLPGLTIDRFGDRDVITLTTVPMVARRSQIDSYLQAYGAKYRTWLYPKAALEREGLREIPSPSHDGPLPQELAYRENGLDYLAPAPPSQKTGAYLDQRDNRLRFAQMLSSKGGVLLDVGCHMGGFSLQAARMGHNCIALDQSQRVLDYVQKNAKLNGLQDRIETRKADMFAPVSTWSIPTRLDAIVFDPPKVANNPRDRKKAMLAMTASLSQLWTRLGDGGLLAICSCSHHLNFEHLDTIVHRASEAEHPAQIARWGPGVDHPVALCHHAGHYLRVAVYRR